jgi:hypothetical protein
MARINLISVADRKDPEGRITKFSFAFPVILRQLEETTHSFDIYDTPTRRIEELGADISASQEFWRAVDSDIQS